MRWDVLFGSFPALLSALPLTLELALTSIALGFMLAVLLATARLSGVRALSALAYAFVYVIRGTPLLAQVFFVYYGLGANSMRCATPSCGRSSGKPMPALSLPCR
ncbi:MAG TPA: ABC transporter permease subunit [Mesorhizobium sp.]|jgi:octopine/nopaline transport system permease protein|uniref:ABC transporter permease subunit n=1 Tax=Mesorhizobium sp. TaxID=1871066 RepID=UPI002DDCCD82|nr:ABC transporter permease subunit [Mesorhizobium sp.]HEV2506970.1 ABC transporter permease subunit [Mesorhizobium sp.]